MLNNFAFALIDEVMCPSPTYLLRWGKLSYSTRADRTSTRPPGETPDTARHHPQCHMKTTRETQGDEQDGGERRRDWKRKERRWRTAGGPMASQRHCQWKLSKKQCCRSFLHTHSVYVYLVPLQLHGREKEQTCRELEEIFLKSYVR